MTRTSLCSLVTVTGHTGCFIIIGYHHVLRLWAGLEYSALLFFLRLERLGDLTSRTAVPVRVAQLQLKTPVLTTSCLQLGTHFFKASCLMHTLDVPDASPIYVSARSSTTVACQGSNQGTEKSWQKASASYKGAGHQPWQILARLFSKTRQLPIIRCRGTKAPFILKTSLYSVQWAPERVLL